MLNSGNVILVGPMGSGKSAVGRMLSGRLGLEFVDSDSEIELRTGGEAGFRVREAEVLDEITRREGVLVATGGGAVLDPRTRERLRGRGCVVYLRTSVDQQLARTRRNSARPLLMNADPRGTLERLMQQRAPLYEEVADLTVDTDRRKVASVVEEILNRLEIARSA